MRLRDKMVSKFLWWMTERHDIYLRRKKGQPWPWTDDEIMRTYSFTNVYRELDRVTQELHARIDPLCDEPFADRLFHAILFRAFNWPATYDRLMAGDALSARDPRVFEHKIARRTLKEAAKTEKVFTGAYIISNGGSTKSKIDYMCDALKVIHAARREIWTAVEHDGTMRGATMTLAQYPSMGKFTSYEVACDLRYQKGMLDRAPDRMTWANLGPGARRGIQRMVAGGENVRLVGKEYDEEWFVDKMRVLLDCANKELPGRMPRLEMREIEMSLCEFDKYLRVERGEGRPRSRYRAPTT